MKYSLLFALIAPTLISGAALAQASDTLEKIRQTGSITLGHRDSSIPFSYSVGSGEPIGYAIDICAAVVAAVKDTLQMPNLVVKYQLVTSQNRVPLVENGTVDLECGSTTNTLARQEQVSFGPNYIMVGVSAAVKKSSGIKSFAELDARTISTTTGTTSTRLLRTYKKTENIQVKEIYGKDHADSFLLLESGRASAFIMDDVLLAGQIATSLEPDNYEILTETLRQEPYGIMFRKDDTAFKQLVDTTVGGLMKSGKINEMYAKWFTTPIPPRGVNLNYPMSEATKALYLSPSDQGI